MLPLAAIVKPVKVPTLVMFGCAAVVTVAAEPVVFWLSVATRAAATVPVVILLPFSADIPLPLPVNTPVLAVIFAPVIVPLTPKPVNVPTDVMFGCAAVVTVPAVVAAPVSAPTNVVDVTLVSPATDVTVAPSVNVVLPNTTFEFANLACASVPLETLLAFSADIPLPLPVNTPVFAVIFAAVTLPLTARPVKVPTLVMFG
jgi:hypothetical protein